MAISFVSALAIFLGVPGGAAELDDNGLLPRAQGGTGTALGAVVRLGGSGAAISHTGTTAETTLASVVIPGGWEGPNGFTDTFFRATCNNNANNKTLRVKIGATSYKARIMTTVISEQGIVRIQNRNNQALQIAGDPTSTTYFGQTGNAHQTGAIDTSAAHTLTITGQLANSADTLVLEMWTLTGAYGA